MRLTILVFFIFGQFACSYSQSETVTFRMNHSDWEQLKDKSISIRQFQKLDQELTMTFTKEEKGFSSVGGDWFFQDLFGEMLINFSKTGIRYRYNGEEKTYIAFADSISNDLAIPTSDKKIKVTSTVRNGRVNVIDKKNKLRVIEFFCETSYLDDFPYILGFDYNGYLQYVAIPNNEFYMYEKSALSDEITRFTYWRQE